MIDVLVFFGLLLVGLGVAAAVWRSARARALGRQRMAGTDEVAVTPQPEADSAARSFLVRHRVAPWMLGLAVSVVVHLAFGWGLPFAIAVGLIVGLLGGQLESYLAVRKTAKIETQLADAIDLMVAALGAGAGVADALENVLRESRNPLRPQLEEVVGRSSRRHSAFNRKPAAAWPRRWRAWGGRFATASRLPGASAPTRRSPTSPRWRS
jgi:tight adherence protein B